MGVYMLAVQGFYDGNTVQTIEKIQAKKNQKLIITVLDEFLDATSVDKKGQSARGVIS